MYKRQHETISPKFAYYAGWTYWACHVTYIASKGSGGLKALSWMVFQNGTTYDTFPTIAVQLATLAVLLFFSWVASRGLNPLKKLATIAGTSMFVMSILYILMMFAAPVINPKDVYKRQMQESPKARTLRHTRKRHTTVSWI